MGIRFSCPNGHKLNVKVHLAGKRGVCPQCGAKIVIPAAEDGAESSSPPAVERPQPSTDAGTLPQIRTDVLSEGASPSIIIKVAESTELEAPPAAPVPASSTVSEVVDSPLIPDPSLIAEAVSVPKFAEDVAPASPETRYLLQQQRRRRNQMTIAISLLIAVIVLAIVLIFVLQRGASQPAAPAETSAT